MTDKLISQQRSTRMMSIREIIALVDIVEVIHEHTPVIKRGSIHVSLCPFHNDHAPSLQIDGSKQVYYCFPCHAGGNVITFLTRLHNWTTSQAIRWIARRAGVLWEPRDGEVESQEEYEYSAIQQEIIGFHTLLSSYYEHQLALALKSDYAVSAFLDKRRLDMETLSYYGIGWASGNDIDGLLKSGFTHAQLETFSIQKANGSQHFAQRIMFPLSNAHGDIVAFCGRTLADEVPKYLNSNESAAFHKSEILYNYHRALPAIKTARRVYLVEGIFDVIALHSARIDNAVALLGVTLSEQQIRLLQGYEVILALDNDQAGQSATLNLILVLLAANIPVSILAWDPKYKDIDELWQEQGDSGVLAHIRHNICSLADFLYSHYRAYTPEQPSDLIRIVQEIRQYLPYLRSLERDWLIQQLAEHLRIGPGNLDPRWQRQWSVNRRGNRNRQRDTQTVNNPPGYVYPIIQRGSQGDKLELYELRILRALLESATLRDYFNQHYFATGQYFHLLAHNHYLQWFNQNQSEEESNKREMQEDIKAVAERIMNTAMWPQTIDELEECIMHARQPNIYRLNPQNKRD